MKIVELRKEVKHIEKCVISKFKKERAKDSLERIHMIRSKVLQSVKEELNPLSANHTKWPTDCLSTFYHFVGLAVKGLNNA